MDNTPINAPVSTEPNSVTTPVVSEPNPVTEPIAQPSVVETTTVQQPKKNNLMKIILITLITLLVLAGIGAGVWYFYFRDKGTTTNDNTNNNTNTTTDNTNNNQDNTDNSVDPKTYNSTLLYVKIFSKSTDGLSRFDLSTKKESDLPNVSKVSHDTGTISIYQRYGTRYAIVNTITNINKKGETGYVLSRFDKSDNSLKEIKLPIETGLDSIVRTASISINGNKVILRAEYGKQSTPTIDAPNFDLKYTDVLMYDINTEKFSSLKRITGPGTWEPNDETWSKDSRYAYILCENDFCASATDTNVADLAGLTTIDTEKATFTTDTKYKTWEGVYASSNKTFLITTFGTPSEVFIDQNGTKLTLHSGEFADFQTPQNLSPDQKYALYDKETAESTLENTLFDTMVVNLEAKTETQLFKGINYFTIRNAIWISNTELLYIKDQGTNQDNQKSIGLFKVDVTTGVSTQLLSSDKYL